MSPSGRKHHWYGSKPLSCTTRLVATRTPGSGAERGSGAVCMVPPVLCASAENTSHNSSSSRSIAGSFKDIGVLRLSRSSYRETDQARQGAGTEHGDDPDFETLHRHPGGEGQHGDEPVDSAAFRPQRVPSEPDREVKSVRGRLPRGVGGSSTLSSSSLPLLACPLPAGNCLGKFCRPPSRSARRYCRRVRCITRKESNPGG